MSFKDEENEEVLDRMRAQGDDLTKARDVDFSLVFPSQALAEGFAGYLRASGYEVDVKPDGPVKELPWDVRVVKSMVPTNEGITAFEYDLQELANEFGGRNDGWGCLTETPAPLMN